MCLDTVRHRVVTSRMCFFLFGFSFGLAGLAWRWVSLVFWSVRAAGNSVSGVFFCFSCSLSSHLPFAHHSSTAGNDVPNSPRYGSHLQRSGKCVSLHWAWLAAELSRGSRTLLVDSVQGALVLGNRLILPFSILYFSFFFPFPVSFAFSWFCCAFSSGCTVPFFAVVFLYPGIVWLLGIERERWGRERDAWAAEGGEGKEKRACAYGDSGGSRSHTHTHTHTWICWLVGWLPWAERFIMLPGWSGYNDDEYTRFCNDILKSSNQIIIATSRASVHLCFDPTMTASYHLQRRDAVNTKPTGISTTPIAGHSREQVTIRAVHDF